MRTVEQIQATVPFIIVADLRTGSTLLSTTLDRHPEIRCYGELFHPRDLPDNQIPGQDRHRASGEAVIERALGAANVHATGFRAMVFLPLPTQSQWADAWDCLRRMEDLHVICLTRENRLAQYASVQIAHRTGAYHPPPGDPLLRARHRPTLRVDPGEFRSWMRERDDLYAKRRSLLEGKPLLELTYEELVRNWEAATRGVQEFLGAPPIRLRPAKQKQESRPLSEVIINYDQVAAHDA